MANRVYEAEYRLTAQLGSGFSKTFQAAQKELAATQKEIQAMGRAQADISAYQKQQSAVEATGKKLEVLQQQYDNIQREIQETSGFSSSLENRLLSKQQQIEKTSGALDRQTEKLNQMGDALKEAGVDTGNLEQESARLESQIDELAKQEAEAADGAEDFGSSGVEAAEAIRDALAAAGIIKTLKAIYDAYNACVDASMDFESAMTGVAKTTDFTDAEFAAISADIKDLSTDIPATTTELAAISEAAGQLGIEKASLLDFTEVMAMLGTATNMTSEEAATMLAQFSSITGMDPSFYQNLGSTIVALGNNYATTEKNIADMSQTIAAAGSIAGMSEAEITAIAAAVTSLGISAQNGGTQMTKLISDINSAVSSGENLEDWARVAGMSADDFAAAWGKNAANALDLFIVGLNGAYESGQDVYSILSQLGITETRMVTMITSLAKSGNRLTSTLQTANQAWAQNTALTSEAEKRYATTQSQLVLMQNAYNNLKVAVGDNYTPALQNLYALSSKLIKGITEFVEKHPALVKLLSALTVSIGTYVTSLTAYIVVSKLAKIAQDSLNKSMLANPYLLAATAITGVVTALFALVSSIDDTDTSVRDLTETSREEYDQLQELEAEYQRICDVQGENSEEAEYLAWRIDDLTKKFEANKQSLAEYVDESSEAYKSMMSMLDANRDAAAEIDINEGTTLALVHRLQELAGQTEKTVETQEEMKAIIAELNEVVPELGFNYEDVVNGVTDYATAIEAAVRAQAASQRYEQNQQAMVDALNAQYEAQQHLGDATDQQTAALKRRKIAEAELNAVLSSQMERDPTGRSLAGLDKTDVYKEAQAAREAYDTYTAEVERWQEALDAATTEYETYLQDLVAYAENTGDAIDATAAMSAIITDATADMEALAEAYTLAYDAAYASVSGQYALWDKAAEVVATSAQDINSSIESQIAYWQDYNANLASLGDRAGDIEGLNDMLASFADGSADSVNAVAGMAEASDEDLRSMVANWKMLQDEQGATADSIAELQTDFTNSMNELQKEFENTVENMELSDVAAESARSTIQAFIDKADQMLPQVEAAYARLGRAASDALSTHTAGGSTGYSTIPAHANGTTYAEDAFIAGDDGPELILGRRGASVFPAQETQRIIDALPNSGNGGGTQITFAPVYHLEGVSNAADLESVLRDHDEEMREFIRQVVADADADAVRRRY